MPTENPKELVAVDFYPGGYGPTIRISTTNPDHLLALKSAFLSLGSDNQIVLNIDDVVPVKMMEIKSLTFKVTHTPESQRIMRSSLDGDKPEFVWIQSASDWNKCAGLVDGLINSTIPCHQYLSEEGVDDVLIELSYRE